VAKTELLKRKEELFERKKATLRLEDAEDIGQTFQKRKRVKTMVPPTR